MLMMFLFMCFPLVSVRRCSAGRRERTVCCVDLAGCRLVDAIATGPRSVVDPHVRVGRIGETGRRAIARVVHRVGGRRAIARAIAFAVVVGDNVTVYD
ncbi:MAG: hypothetical protein JWN64_826 [Parcubacteria group bacterium]|nr:hypothetical protein [Parcubacteria group bacterium]